MLSKAQLLPPTTDELAWALLASVFIFLAISFGMVLVVRNL